MRTAACIGVVILLGACKPITHPPPPCAGRNPGECANTFPPIGGGGGGGSDAGTTDAGNLTTPQTVTGTVVLATSLPVGDTMPFVVAPNWTVTAPTQVVETMATTASNGTFSLTQVPFEMGLTTLQASPPSSANALGSVTYARGTTGVTLVAMDVVTLQGVAQAAGVTLDPTAGHVLVRFTGTDASRAGLRVRALNEASVTALYDDPSGVMTATRTETGPRGNVLLLNVPVSASAARTVTLGLSRTTGTEAQFVIDVVSGNLTWLPLVAP